MELHINPELEKIVPPLSEEDDNELDKSLAGGQWIGFPLTVAPDGDVCDGMNRFKKLTAKGIEPKYVIDKSLDTLEKKKLFVILNVVARRHLNNWQKGKLGLELLKLAPIGAKGQKTAEVVADKIPGLSTRTFERIITIEKNASPSVIKSLDKGTMSIDTAWKISTRKQRNLPKVDLPEGVFDVIYADPPLQFQNRSIRGASDNHYETMTLGKICHLHDSKGKLLEHVIAKDAVLFLWMPSSMFFDEQEVDTDVVDSTVNWILSSWGFKAKTFFVGIKNKFGTGSYTRNQHENLIIAYKGKMPTPLKLFPSIINFDNTEHSAKPEIVYSMIEEMYPKRKYLELFARGDKNRKGWTYFGNELKVNGGSQEAPSLDHIKEITVAESRPVEKPIDKLKKSKLR